MSIDPTKETDDVSGAALAANDLPASEDAAKADDLDDEELDSGPDPDAIADAPPHVTELAAACVRFVASRYRATLDFTPDTLSLLDQWLCEARAEPHAATDVFDLVQSSAGAYLGEVFRREFGAQWFAEGELSGWRLYLSRVYCSFNPIGMAREALLLDTAEGWCAHLELDPAERDSIDARLAALPQATDEEYYAPSTRFDVLSIVVDALRAGLRSRGLGDVRFSAEDYR